MDEANYWLVTIKYKFTNLKNQIQNEIRQRSIWADSKENARFQAESVFNAMTPKGFIVGTESYETRPMTRKEVSGMEKVFKK